MICCKMREKFLIGIIAENSALPDPVDAVDFIDFDANRDDGKPVIRAAFCPFCGAKLIGPLRVVDPPPVMLFDPSAVPIPMILRCPMPACSTLHVDEGEWATKPHRTHLCLTCGAKWRPANVPTVGVLSLPEER